MLASTTKIREVMSTTVLFARLDNSFTELCRLFFEVGIHHLPVIDDQGELVGMLSASDVLKAFCYQLPCPGKATEKSINDSFKIGEIMTPMPIQTINPEDSVMLAAKRFATFGIHALPVIENEKVIGIITTNDLIDSLAAVEERVYFI